MSWQEDKADFNRYRSVFDRTELCPCCGEESPETDDDVFECPNGTLFTTTA